MTADLEAETQATGFVTCVPVLYIDGAVCYVPLRETRTNPDPDALCVLWDRMKRPGGA